MGAAEEPEITREERLAFAKRVGGLTPGPNPLVTPHKFIQDLTDFGIRAERRIVELERGWRPIDSAPKDGSGVIVAMIRNGRVQRLSDAAFRRIGWYTLNGGHACHWATHWMPLPEAEDD